MIRRLLLAIALLLPAAAAASPALFVARAPGLTIYLFGSMHALPADTRWETPRIDRAFDSADQVWFEAVLSELDPGMIASLFSEGLDHEHTLSTRLTAPEVERLHQVAAGLPGPVPFGMIDAMRPWLAALVISAARATQAGFDETSGVEHRLQDRAKAANKPMTAIEDPRQTLHAVAVLPDATGLAMLREALAQKPQTTVFRMLLRSWLAGDVAQLGRTMTRAGASDDSAVMHALLAQRNVAWAQRLAALKGTRATIFLTVGAGHLAGPGNLRDLLARQGFSLSRIPTDGPAR